MTGIADSFKTASFNGIEFPYTDRSIKGSGRHHVHEYPHAPGGDDEPLGRKLYEFGFTCDFDTGFSDRFPNLYPNTLILLFATFDTQIAAPLVLPGFATYTARAIDWDTRLSARIRSGEKVSFKFIEVLDEILAVQIFTTPPAAIPDLTTALQTKVTALAAAPLGSLPSNAVPDPADLDNILSISAALSALPTGSPQVPPQASALVAACQAYDTLTFARYARSYDVMEANHELALAAIRLRRDSLLRSRPLLTFVVDMPSMSAADIAIRLYGSTENTKELMSLNGFADALAIPSGTRVQYYGAVT